MHGGTNLRLPGSLVPPNRAFDHEVNATFLCEPFTRNVVERCVDKLKRWRAIATRYEKRAVNFWAAVIVVALVIWSASLAAVYGSE
jgi:transposase